MIISYKWLKEYFEVDLPEPEKLAEDISLKSFEIDGLEKIGDDWAIDVDVLPNRAHDCLSHDGIAKEVSIVTGLPLKKRNPSENHGSFKSDLQVVVEEDSCLRYMAREIKNIKVTESPKELREKLEALGQRSINTLVDITNIVMYQTGQPMHAFDQDKLTGKKILVRKAKIGEEITTLDDNHVILDEDSLLIADEKDPLAIAGIKGGKKPEVDFETRNIILESANFNSTEIRKTSRRLGVATDSSKRFENKISPELTNYALNLATELILKYCSTSETKVSEKIDHYKKPWRAYQTGVSLQEINSLLGVDFSESDVSEAFKKLGFEFNLISPRETILEKSQELVGKPYKHGASVFFDAPEKFDCSSFVSYVYSLAGFSIPKMAVDQYVFSDRIERENLKPGDLIFFNTSSKNDVVRFESQEFLPGIKIEKGINHVGIYLGDEKIIHATGRDDVGVTVENLDQNLISKNIIGYGSIILSDEKRFAVKSPIERLDLRTGPDLIEEVARVIGYHKIKDQEINIKNFNPRLNKRYQLNTLIRKILSEIGYSEVITYVFCDQGEIEPEKPISEDKAYLRHSLEWGINSTFEKNLNNADLLNLDHLKVFEIGKVFNKKGEREVLALGVANKKGIKKPKSGDILLETVKHLEEKLGLKIENKINSDTQIIEVDLEKISENFENTDSYPELPKIPEETTYRPISQYPFLLRDIAVWVPDNFGAEDILKIAEEQASELLVNSRLFDIYKKDEKVSYAFRLVFQSKEKTLTDEEANKIMDTITKTINQKDGWEVR